MIAGKGRQNGRQECGQRPPQGECDSTVAARARHRQGALSPTASAHEAPIPQRRLAGARRYRSSHRGRLAADQQAPFDGANRQPAKGASLRRRRASPSIQALQAFETRRVGRWHRLSGKAAASGPQPNFLGWRQTGTVSRDGKAFGIEGTSHQRAWQLAHPPEPKRARPRRRAVAARRNGVRTSSALRHQAWRKRTRG